MKVQQKIHLFFVWILPVLAIFAYPKWKYGSLNKYDLFPGVMYNYLFAIGLSFLAAIMLIQIWKNLNQWTKWHQIACGCNLILFLYVGIGLILMNFGQKFPLGVFIIADIRNLIFVETIYAFFFIEGVKKEYVIEGVKKEYVKKLYISNFVCLCAVIFCMLYAKIYLEKIYYYPRSEFFMILYQYFVYQIFCFCSMKIFGSMMKKRKLIEIDIIKRKQFFLTALIGLYLSFVFLIEIDIFDIVLILSPIRFLVYACFGAAGLLVGLSDTI